MNKLLAYFRCLRGRISLSSQEGSMLIEVMIGAVLVVSVSAAVLDGLAGAEDTGRTNRARSVSASIAQQDQERLRGKPVAQLSNYRETRTVTLQNINYTVESRADWVRDASGAVSCTNDSTAAQYLKISSSVNSLVNSQTPITQTSLVSPPRGTFNDNQGTAAVQVVDREQKPLEGVRVDLTGPQSFSDVTNDLGCVVFGYIQEGPWKAKVTSLGLVGTDGTSPYVTDLDVVGGSTVVKQVLLDRPAAVTTAFDTQLLGASSPVPSTWPSMSIANAQMPSPGWTAFNFATPQLTITAAKVFPFLDGYGVYAGDCDPNNPTNYQDDYFTTIPGSAAFANPDPATSATVVARVPTINIEVQNSSGVVQSGARVFLESSDSECTTPAWASGTTTPSPWRQTTTPTGTLPLPSFPFGPYTICADNNGTSTTKVRSGSIALDNKAAAGTPKTVIKLGSSTNSVYKKWCYE